jgi:hypothetical protein
MHPYATDSAERRYIPLILATISIALAWVLGLLPWRIPWWVDAPSVVGFYGFLYAWFDRRLWRARWLRKIGLVRVPNLSGEWSGFVKSSHDNITADHDVSLAIRQTWSHLSVVLRAEQSRSCSLIAAIHIDDPDGPALVYEYRNEPSSLAVETMHVHRGITHLTFDKDDDSLSGDYYTGRDRQTHGGIRVVRKPKEQS